MMLAIRLRRTGSKKRPFFRVVVTDSRAARDSSFVEVLGHYNPRTKPGDAEARSRAAGALAETGRAAVRHRADAASRACLRRTVAAAGGAARVVSRARDVVEVVARALADRPDAVRVTEREHTGQTLVELFMAPGDWGASSAARVAPPLRCGRWSRLLRSSRGEGHAGVPGRAGSTRESLHVARRPGRRVEWRWMTELGGSGARRPGGASARDPRPGGGEPGDGLSRRSGSRPAQVLLVGARGAAGSSGGSRRSGSTRDARFVAFDGVETIDEAERLAGAGRLAAGSERWRRCRSGRITGTI